MEHVNKFLLHDLTSLSFDLTALLFISLQEQYQNTQPTPKEKAKEGKKELSIN